METTNSPKLRARTRAASLAEAMVYVEIPARPKAVDSQIHHSGFSRFDTPRDHPVEKHLMYGFPVSGSGCAVVAVNDRCLPILATKGGPPERARNRCCHACARRDGPSNALAINVVEVAHQLHFAAVWQRFEDQLSFKSTELVGVRAAND